MKIVEAVLDSVLDNVAANAQKVDPPPPVLSPPPNPNLGDKNNADADEYVDLDRTLDHPDLSDSLGNENLN